VPPGEVKDRGRQGRRKKSGRSRIPKPKR
jgi:hypothetical protein